MTSTNSNPKKPLIQWINQNWIYLLFAFSVLLFVYTRYIRKPNRSDWVQLTYTTYHTPLGWGYDVLVNDSLFIHQQQMPAVEGNRGFSSQKEAEKVAELVIARMKRKELPTILLRDLDSLGISR
jgi:hypothetical protein